MQEAQGEIVLCECATAAKAEKGKNLDHHMSMNTKQMPTFEPAMFHLLTQYYSIHFQEIPALGAYSNDSPMAGT